MRIDVEGPEVKEIELNWRAYFLRFCEEHGGNPVNHRGRLLFSDGWEYSSSDYAGPEWAPHTGTEMLRGMKRFYWSTRLGVTGDVIKRLRFQIDKLEQLQSGKSVPLQCMSVYRDSESNSTVRRIVDVDFITLRNDITGLESYAEHCKRQIRKLGGV